MGTYTQQVLDAVEKHRHFEPFREILYRRLNKEQREMFFLQPIAIGELMKLPIDILADSMVEALIATEADWNAREMEGKV